MASGAVVMFLGDSIAQSVEMKGQQTVGFDWIRSAVMVSWAAVGDVPINLLLFGLVDRTWRSLGFAARSSLRSSVVQALFFFTPGVIIRNPCFIAYCTTAEHMAHNVADRHPAHEGLDLCASSVLARMTEDLGTIMLNSAKLWLPVNTFTFYLVPREYRAIWTSSVAVCWITYLSMVQHRARALPEKSSTSADA